MIREELYQILIRKGFNAQREKKVLKFMQCPRCEYPRMKSWRELNTEEKFLAERLPMSAEYTQCERENHLFCPRCWNEIAEKKSEIG